MNDEAPIAELSFEQALAELEGVVTRLESSAVTLEESITLFARGSALREHCETKLVAAEARVEAITRTLDGTVATRPVDIP